MTFSHDDGNEVFLGRDLGRSRNYSEEEVAAVIDKGNQECVTRDPPFKRAYLFNREKG